MIPLLLTAALATGFRGDGSGHWPDATPPTSVDTPAWSISTSTWGNASVLPVGDLACATIEPTTLVCYDRATGAERWRATNDYLDTLSGAEHAALEAKLAEAEALQVRMTQTKAELSRLRRELRRANSGVTAAEVEAASRTLDDQRTRLDEVSPYLTPPNKDIIGYASPTPVTDGTRIYAQFGNGVLSAFSLSGTRLWTRWFGAPLSPMTGYDFGSSASPLLLDGDLLTNHGRLRRIDSATGADRWVDDRPWTHYGAPAIARSAGKPWIGTADGRVLDGTSGKQVASGLADLWYSGPTGSGDVLYWAGGKGNGGNPQNASAVGVRLVPEGGTVRAEPLFRTTYPKAARVYMAPLVVGDELYTVTDKGLLVVFDRHKGTIASSLDLSANVRGDVFQGLQRVGNALVLADDRGHIVVLEPGRSPTVRTALSLGEENRSTPAFADGHMFLRTVSGLRSYALR